ncbi:MAG: hypothetical protein AAFV43_10515 [Planctomycetota bacterium]
MAASKTPAKSSARSTKTKAAARTAAKKPATKAGASKTGAKKSTAKAGPTKSAKKPAARSAAKKTTDAEVKIDRRRASRRDDETAKTKSPAGKKAADAGAQAGARTEAEPVIGGKPDAKAPKLERREKVNRRRQIDPTTCERDYSDAEVEFMNALDDYKRTSGRMFPTCSEVLEVILNLGYAKLTPAELAARKAAAPPADEAELEDAVAQAAEEALAESDSLFDD